MSIDRITDTLFWPVLDVVLWGLTSVWLTTQTAPSGRAETLVLAILSALLFWRVLWQSNYEVGVNLLEECWNRNLTNLFASPLTKSEWLIGNLIVGLLKLVVVVITVSATIWIFYSLNVFTIGIIWVPFFISLVLTGWSLGFLASGLVLIFGLRAQALTWTLAFLFVPLSAVYYPVSSLPEWVQPISWVFPQTYVFEGLRRLVLEGRNEYQLLLQSFLMNAVYLSVTLWFFSRMFERGRERGFDHLE